MARALSNPHVSLLLGLIKSNILRVRPIPHFLTLHEISLKIAAVRCVWRSLRSVNYLASAFCHFSQVSWNYMRLIWVVACIGYWVSSRLNRCCSTKKSLGCFWLEFVLIAMELLNIILRGWRWEISLLVAFHLQRSLVDKSSTSDGWLQGWASFLATIGQPLTILDAWLILNYERPWLALCLFSLIDGLKDHICFFLWDNFRILQVVVNGLGAIFSLVSAILNYLRGIIESIQCIWIIPILRREPVTELLTAIVNCASKGLLRGVNVLCVHQVLHFLRVDEVVFTVEGDSILPALMRPSGSIWPLDGWVQGHCSLSLWYGLLIKLVVWWPGSPHFLCLVDVLLPSEVVLSLRGPFLFFHVHVQIFQNLWLFEFKF